MTADFFPFEPAFLGRVANRIVNEVKGINWSTTSPASRRGRSSGSEETSSKEIPLDFPIFWMAASLFCGG